MTGFRYGKYSDPVSSRYRASLEQGTITSRGGRQGCVGTAPYSDVRGGGVITLVKRIRQMSPDTAVVILYVPRGSLALVGVPARGMLSEREREILELAVPVLEKLTAEHRRPRPETVMAG